jgi:two-component system phosphate regulon sensor histidine kinase PhoR
MKDRIRYSLIYMGILAALFAVYFTMRVFEGEMAEQLKSQLRENLSLIETAYINESLDSVPDKLAKFANKDLRITLIDSKGGILYDSDAEAVKMENHNNREEVIDAFAKGVGEDLRYSSTLQAKAFYFAKRLGDGNVLRLGMRQANLQQVFSKTIPYLIVLLAAIVVAAILIATGLSRVFISPLQKLVDQLGTPEWQNIENVYKEIDPLVNTIRKQDLELQLTIEQLSNEKQKISHLKDEFTANASHELKTPLTSISGYAELIENGMAKPEDIKVFAGKIHKEAQRLQSIANDIITLSKLNNRETEPFDLSEKINLWNLSHSCIEELILNANKKSIQLNLDGDQNAEIQGNSKLLFEMIFNLVDNAIRYTEQGGKVVVLVEPNAIVVKDTGIGIPEECQPRIFERFYRVDKSRSKETGGTGLGLAIVKHIAEVLHATIHLNSTVGFGTEVRIEFPPFSKTSKVV